jgi:hypothetical protein
MFENLEIFEFADGWAAKAPNFLITAETEEKLNTLLAEILQEESAKILLGVKV